MQSHARNRSGRPPRTLQGHIAFFDRDNDGIIWPIDTFKSSRAIGFGILFSLLSMILIHGGFSYWTFGTLLPDPFFRIRVSHIHRALHGSDSGSFTQTGEFDERRFDYVFDLYSSAPHTHLAFSEGVNMIRGNRNLYDVFGWFATVFEWGATYLLLWPEDGRLSKQDVHDIMDGSLFPRLAAQNINKNSKKEEAQKAK
ncbi:Caleosin [Mycena maculata]|uniref:Caleosin n=1 Tax=Mycena maculata TaxID=230809 RepID=A0AAD7ILX8_9AGAR|nr:Caleosin [Mycena maculata]